VIGRLLEIYSGATGLGVRGLAKEIGVSGATISRIINGKEVTQDTMLKIINWLFKN